MTEPRQKTYIESFRRAIREAKLSGDEFSLGSLIASAQGVQILVPVLRDELAPIAGELELHLRGDNVEGHSANAQAFSELVRRVAEATKCFVRDKSKSKKQTSDLLVDTGPGSVRVTLKAPCRQVKNATPLVMENPGEILPVEDNYSEALRRIAVVLANSDPEAPGGEALGAAIEQLPPEARNELAHALEPVRKQNWQVSGTFAQRGVGSSELHFEKRHAEFLRHQLKAEYTESETWTSTGRLDGHRWSNGITYFVPSDNSRTIPASFADAELQMRAAEIAASEDNRVEARFTVHIRRSMSSSKASRSYELVAITAI